MKNKQIRSNVMLFLAALIWGLAFVAQDVAMDYIRPFTFTGLRSILGGAILLPVIAVMKTFSTGKKEAYKESNTRREGFFHSLEFIGGVCCGLVLFVASNIQQFGIMDSSPGKAGFLTALYILIVPIMGLFLGKKVLRRIWGCVAIALVGAFLLCVTDSFSIEKGDILLILCAICFSVHILVIDYFSPKANGIIMSSVQFFTCGILSLICMVIFEHPEIKDILQAWISICYAGIMSSGVAFTLQILGQKNTSPTVASLIMSMESVFACLGGFVILGQGLSNRELVGSLLVFGAIILAQLPAGKKKTFSNPT